MPIFFQTPLKIIKSILIVSTFFLFSFFSFGQSEFDSSTDELYWDVNERVRFLYVPACRLDGVMDQIKPSFFHNVMNKINFFGVVIRGQKHIVCAHSGGIKIVDKQGYFFSDYKKSNHLEVNGESLLLESDISSISNNHVSFTLEPILFNKQKTEWYFGKLGDGTYDYFHGSSSRNNLSTLLNARNENDEVIIKEISESPFYPYNEEVKSIKILFNVSGFDAAEKARNDYVESYISVIENEIIAAYIFIFVCYFFLVCSVVGAMYFTKIKFFPYLKQIFERFHTVENEKKSKIIKRDKLASYSVADELMKWTKLREDGHISEKQYLAAKKEILGEDS
jgi:hypothetical protein